MKKLIALALAFILVFPLVACGSSGKHPYEKYLSEKHPFEDLILGMNKEEVQKVLGKSLYIGSGVGKTYESGGYHYCLVPADEYSIEFLGQKSTMWLTYDHYVAEYETIDNAGLLSASINFVFSNVEAYNDFLAKVYYYFTEKYGEPECDDYDDDEIWYYSYKNCEIEVYCQGREILLYWDEWDG